METYDNLCLFAFAISDAMTSSGIIVMFYLIGRHEHKKDEEKLKVS